MKISIVITAYNVGEWLNKAILSCVNQTYKNLEIIIVNDKSTDNTKQIIVDWFKKDNRIKFINHKTNLGPGLSRRDGISFATGEYVLLLDGDDYLNEDFIEDLQKEAESSNADMISGGINIIYPNEKFSTESYGRYYLEGADKINKTFGNRVVFLNNMIVRRKLYDIVKYSNRRYVEDTQSLLMLLYYANKVSYIPNPGYNYLMRDSSLTHTKTSAKDALFKGLCYKDILEFFKSVNCNDYNDKFNINQIFFYLKELNSAIMNGESISKYYKEYVEFMTYTTNILIGK